MEILDKIWRSKKNTEMNYYWLWESFYTQVILNFCFSISSVQTWYILYLLCLSYFEFYLEKICPFAALQFSLINMYINNFQSLWLILKTRYWSDIIKLLIYKVIIILNEFKFFALVKSIHNTLAYLLVILFEWYLLLNILKNLCKFCVLNGCENI